MLAKVLQLGLTMIMHFLRNEQVVRYGSGTTLLGMDYYNQKQSLPAWALRVYAVL